MSESNAFAPDVSDMGKHLFFVILGAVILIIVLIAIHFFVFKKHKKVAVVKHSYETGMVSDTQPHKPVENTVLDFPQDELKYSFTFFLEISDFYSNKGYWKCIMIKGDSFNDLKKATLCVNSLPDVGRKSDITNCFQNEPVCDYFAGTDNETKCSTLLRKLKEKIELDKENPTEGMNERLDVICRSLELGDKGKEILCKAASKCGLFTRNQKDYFIREGICQRFLDRHKDYCDNVYAIDKKVERLQDEERIRNMIQNHDLSVEDAKTVQDYKDAKDRIEVEKRFDDYDNIYNLQHFLKEFQELLPKNLEELNENDLINLSEGHPLNQPHSVRNPLHLEGNYDFEAGKILFDNKVEYSRTTTVIATAVANGNSANTAGFPVNNNNEISKINNEAEEKGYQYFGIEIVNGDTSPVDTTDDEFKAYFYSEEQVKKALELGEKDLDGENYDADRRVPKILKKIFITKVKKPGETITKDCWKDVIESYPNQNPGVWLHPFVNDIRIVFTTNSEKPYQYFLARSPHATSTNHNNYHVSQKGLGEIKTANIIIGNGKYFSIANSEGLKLNVGDKISFTNPNNGIKEERIIDTIGKHSKSIDTHMAGTLNADWRLAKGNKIKIYKSNETKKQQHYYREFFDIKNIPIKEEFHLAIVVNGKIVEVYINGGLTTTQQLFGNPNYNNGKLHISPQELDIANKKIKLGGIVRGFKYYPRTINYNNIKTLIKNKKFRQTIGGEPDLIAAEHKHNLSFSHEHAYDQVEDKDHKHSVPDEDISKSFYSN